ncbi:MAG: hypothetical protein EPO26_07005 [Chloroflexota bacterium]|nr:MAG: hypothetical protein EPO26_07005 [Chloroflexota bacterium]
MVYEIWRNGSWSLSGAFATRDEALAALRASIATQEPELVRGCTLALVDSRGRRRTVAEGQQLVDQALAYHHGGRSHTMPLQVQPRGRPISPGKRPAPMASKCT